MIAPTARIKVLVAEGNHHFGKVLRWVLHEDGRFSVVGDVSTTEELLAFEGSFDLVLLDLGITGRHGVSVIAGLRRRTPTPEVVVLSRTGVSYLRQAMAAAGATGFLVVPEELDHLGQRLVALVAPRPVGSSPADLLTGRQDRRRPGSSATR